MKVPIIPSPQSPSLHISQIPHLRHTTLPSPLLPLPSHLTQQQKCSYSSTSYHTSTTTTAPESPTPPPQTPTNYSPTPILGLHTSASQTTETQTPPNFLVLLQRPPHSPRTAYTHQLYTSAYTESRLLCLRRKWRRRCSVLSSAFCNMLSSRR